MFWFGATTDVGVPRNTAPSTAADFAIRPGNANFRFHLGKAFAEYRTLGSNGDEVSIDLGARIDRHSPVASAMKGARFDLCFGVYDTLPLGEIRGLHDEIVADKDIALYGQRHLSKGLQIQVKGLHSGIGFDGRGAEFRVERAGLGR